MKNIITCIMACAASAVVTVTFYCAERTASQCEILCEKPAAFVQSARKSTAVSGCKSGGQAADTAKATAQPTAQSAAQTSKTPVNAAPVKKTAPATADKPAAEKAATDQVKKAQPADVKPLVKSTDYEIPQGDTSFKTYTYYTSLNRNSAQWKLQQEAYTDENGLRKMGGDYMVALGSYYSGTLGERFLVTLDGGETFTVVVCDFKSDRHTDSANQYSPVNAQMKNVVEFYVDKNLDSAAKRMGDVSYIEGFKGNITAIEKI
ncbi:MAG: hypothetical protein FWF05_02240 [Oscillospiraceae bacterium]|nr:hypothetical protein [Oscillospiraceae bacterium]